MCFVTVACTERETEDFKSDYCPSHFDVSGDCCVHDSVVGRTSILAELPLRSVLHQIGRHTD